MELLHGQPCLRCCGVGCSIPEKLSLDGRQDRPPPAWDTVEQIPAEKQEPWVRLVGEVSGGGEGWEGGEVLHQEWADS